MTGTFLASNTHSPIKNIHNKCIICGALFKSIWRLNQHLKRFPKHNRDKMNMVFSLTNRRYTFYFRIPSIREYECVYGICDCPSKTQIIKPTSLLPLTLKINTKSGYIFINNIKFENNTINYNDMNTNMFKTIYFYSEDFSNSDFCILFMRGHYWLRLYNYKIFIIPIYSFEFYYHEKQQQFFSINFNSINKYTIFIHIIIIFISYILGKMVGLTQKYFS